MTTTEAGQFNPGTDREERVATNRPSSRCGWRVNFVDRSAASKVAVIRERAAELTSERNQGRSPVNLTRLSRRDRQFALIMLIVEAARHQRLIAGRPAGAFSLRRAHPADRIATPPKIYPLLTAKCLKDLVSDVLLLMNPALAEDFTTATTTQVHGLNLFHPM